MCVCGGGGEVIGVEWGCCVHGEGGDCRQARCHSTAVIAASVSFSFYHVLTVPAAPPHAPPLLLLPQPWAPPPPSSRCQCSPLWALSCPSPRSQTQVGACRRGGAGRVLVLVLLLLLVVVVCVCVCQFRCLCPLKHSSTTPRPRLRSFRCRRSAAAPAGRCARVRQREQRHRHLHRRLLHFLAALQPDRAVPDEGVG